MASTTKTTHKSAKDSPPERFLLVFLLDRTGSMASCYDATVSGFNEFLHQQQRERAGKAFMTLVQFDMNGDEPICQTRYAATKLSAVADLGTELNAYEPRGTTPLFDAVGQTIVSTDKVASRYDHVLFIIQTDGHENASREYRQRQVFEMVNARREGGWDFIFLGADIDAYSVGQALNVPVANTMSYRSASQSAPAFASLSASTTRYRRSSGRTRGATEALEDAPVARPPSAPVTPELEPTGNDPK
jgi:Mg-chelatase subunit ChlD